MRFAAGATHEQSVYGPAAGGDQLDQMMVRVAKIEAAPAPLPVRLFFDENFFLFEHAAPAFQF